MGAMQTNCLGPQPRRPETHKHILSSPCGQGAKRDTGLGCLGALEEGASSSLRILEGLLEEMRPKLSPEDHVGVSQVGRPLVKGSTGGSTGSGKLAGDRASQQLASLEGSCEQREGGGVAGGRLERGSGGQRGRRGGGPGCRTHS